ncbi:A24 family peptidase [Porticoccus sp. W117]|uniref:prepilin peptidase n=1 Tax=Porticoccus sp. W117 TaxID=3054777 RepID=UPI0025943117|nr:A24 family peptidase [Porticoccus sp. W117]MDM3872583.1 A24 family peptidase [Porticoccus sp. W117]
MPELNLPPTLLVGVAVILGLLVGSFLNVVIYRLPMQLQISWREMAREILELKAEVEPRISLAFPASHCPSCNAPIKPWHNIPVVSYLLLKGQCQSCNTKISIQYPTVELFTGLLSGFIIFHYGLSEQGLLVLLFTWCLIALTGIDFGHKLLPDNITLPLMWIGLLANTQGVFTDLTSSVIGGAAGYLSLWSVYIIYKKLTGKEGMGHGDFKLLAALGAWMGWQFLPMIILLSAVVGALVGIAGILVMGRDKQIPIAFGPYLAAAGWIALLWGHDILAWYTPMLAP